MFLSFHCFKRFWVHALNDAHNEYGICGLTFHISIVSSLNQIIINTCTEHQLLAVSKYLNKARSCIKTQLNIRFLRDIAKSPGQRIHFSQRPWGSHFFVKK